jgi:hypothetical protein
MVTCPQLRVDLTWTPEFGALDHSSGPTHTDLGQVDPTAGGSGQNLGHEIGLTYRGSKTVFKFELEEWRLRQP